MLKEVGISIVYEVMRPSVWYTALEVTRLARLGPRGVIPSHLLKKVALLLRSLESGKRIEGRPRRGPLPGRPPREFRRLS